MNCTRALISFSACSVLALSAIAYIKHATEDPTTSLATDPTPMAAKSEVTSPSKADKSQGRDTTDEKIAELNAKLKRLDEKFAALRQEVQTRLAAQTAASTEESDRETALSDPRTDSLALAEAEREEQERVQTLQHNFQNESMTDLEWSSRASAALEKAFASDRAANAQVNNMECRSRQCRVELLFQMAPSEITLWVGCLCSSPRHCPLSP